MKTDIDRQIDELEYRIKALQAEATALRRQRPREKVRDYELMDQDGRAVALSALFDGRDRLILVHNMGRACAFCTLWADGFNAYLPYLESRAALVVSSPDEPHVQSNFARSRGWRFRMVSAHGSPFIDDMGFLDPEEGLMPGVSVFARDPDGTIHRVSRAEFGPGDSFCPVWHFFDLLPEGIDGWEPRDTFQKTTPPDPELHACCRGA